MTAGITMNFDPVEASASPEVPMNEALESLDYSAVYSVRQETTNGGTTWGYRGGRWGGFAVAAGTLTLTNASANYLVVLRSSGVISTSTSSANWDNVLLYARVYKITMAGGVVTAVEDHRAGPNGIFGAIAGAAVDLRGLTFTSDTDSTADSDPGAGLFKWNNATQSSATVLYFDNATADGVSLTTLWGSLGEVGFIYLQQGDDATRWQEWKWTALPVDGTGYRKFTVTLQAASASAIQDNKLVLADFETSVPGAVVGPASATDNAVSRFDGTTGKLVQNSAVTIDDSNNVAGVATLSIGAGAVGAPALYMGGDTTTGLYAPNDNEIGFTVSGALVALFTGGSAVFGHTATITQANASAARFEFHATSANGSSMASGHWANSATSPTWIGAKSRGGSVGTHGAVVAEDDILNIWGEGSDGTAFVSAARIRFEAEGTISSGVVPGRITLATANSAGTITEAFRVDSSQKLLAGTTAAITIGQSNRMQIAGNATTLGGLSLSRFSNDGNGTRIEFSKSRSGTVGTNTIAQSGDALGSLIWYGGDGTDYDAAAQIIAEVDGTPGAGTDMPGRMRFLTSANGTATLTERLRIDNAGNVIVNTAAIATNATDGFLYVPTCAGMPTGTPTAYTGRVPIVVDTSNNKLYFFSGSWRDAGP